MTPHSKRMFHIGCAVLCFPLFLLTLLFGLSLVNPMGLMFLTTFTIENRANEDIWVTPIGAVGSSGTRHLLPLSVAPFPYLMTPSRKDFHLRPGDRRSFTYDWDDIQFSEILVRNKGGAYRTLPTGLPPTEGQYRRPIETAFVVSSFIGLQPTTEVQLQALNTRSSGIFVLYGLVFVGLLFPYFMFRAIKPKNNVEQGAPPNAGPVGTRGEDTSTPRLRR